jgi:hypothetical protein
VLPELPALPSGRWSKFVLTLSRFGWTDAPHTQNFEILKSLEQTQVSKKFKITFKFFVNILDGLNFDKRCLTGCFYPKLFSELENLS